MAQAPDDKSGSGFLSYLNLSSPYERKARFLPGLLCAMSLIPVGVAFGTSLVSWLGMLATGAGLWAVCAVGLSHLASAAGNVLQARLWPNWPHDAPTNLWLRPDDPTRSLQDKQQIYAAIQRLTGLDIPAAVPNGPQDVDATINDAVGRLRNLMRNTPHADRLDTHNVDYGFARNFAGLAPVWLTLLVAGTAGCWVGYARFGTPVLWAAVSTVLTLLAIPAALVLPQYVRVRAAYYAESFYSAVLAVDREGAGKPAAAGQVTSPSR